MLELEIAHAGGRLNRFDLNAHKAKMEDIAARFRELSSERPTLREFILEGDDPWRGKFEIATADHWTVVKISHLVAEYRSPHNRHSLVSWIATHDVVVLGLVVSLRWRSVM